MIFSAANLDQLVTMFYPVHLKFQEIMIINFSVFTTCLPTLECKILEGRDVVLFNVVP